MIKLPQNLCLPYDEVSRMLEKVPGGLTVDQLSSKLFCISRLKKKDLDKLLEYCRQRDRIEVTTVLRKGVETSPLLRHRIHANTPASVDNPEPKITENTVHIATQGRAELIKKDTSKMNTTTQSASEAFLVEHPQLREAAAEIMDALQRNPNGLTRSTLREHSPQYHKLRGANRTDVITYLVEHEGVRDIAPERGAGNTLYYPGHYEKLTTPTQSTTHIDLFNQACDNHKDDDVESILESEEDNIGNKLQPGEAPHYRGNMSIFDIGERIVEILKERDGHEMTLSEIYEALPEYSELNEDERRQCTRRLIESRVISMGRRTSPYVKGSGFLSIWLITEDTKDTVVHQQADRNGDKPMNAMALAMQTALSKKSEPVAWSATANKPEVTAQMETPVVNEPAKHGVASALPSTPAPMDLPDQPTLTPVVAEPATTIGVPQTASEARAEIARLEALAVQLESQERNDALVDALLPLRDELRSEYKRVEQSVTQQIDALAAMGDILNRIDTALGVNNAN